MSASDAFEGCESVKVKQWLEVLKETSLNVGGSVGVELGHLCEMIEKSMNESSNPFGEFAPGDERGGGSRYVDGPLAADDTCVRPMNLVLDLCTALSGDDTIAADVRRVAKTAVMRLLPLYETLVLQEKGCKRKRSLGCGCDDPEKDDSAERIGCGDVTMTSPLLSLTTDDGSVESCENEEVSGSNGAAGWSLDDDTAEDATSVNTITTTGIPNDGTAGDATTGRVSTTSTSSSWTGDADTVREGDNSGDFEEDALFASLMEFELPTEREMTTVDRTVFKFQRRELLMYVVGAVDGACTFVYRKEGGVQTNVWWFDSVGGLRRRRVKVSSGIPSEFFVVGTGEVKLDRCIRAEDACVVIRHSGLLSFSRKRKRAKIDPTDGDIEAVIKDLAFKAHSGLSLVEHITSESVDYLNALRYTSLESQEKLLREQFPVGSSVGGVPLD